MEAWGRSRPEGYELVVAGIAREEAVRWLRERGVDIPAGVRWAGRLDRRAFRALTGSARLYIAASRFEDHGIAQLEALLDGALLITVPSAGPYEPLRLAQRLDSRLVASAVSAEALARAIETAAALTATERADYARRAHALAARYSEDELVQRLRTRVLPTLLGGSWATAAGAR
jgi:glycogen synthase